MRVAMVVHGRFHAFDLARALIARGHDIQIFTNYPVWAAKKFGLPGERIHSYWPHGVAVRILDKMGQRAVDLLDGPMHAVFSRWAARQLKGQQWDVIHTFSGVAEDVFREMPEPRHFLVRGSSHIRVQQQILDEESARTGVRLDRPTQWIVRREEREYELCDRLLVLSTFAHKSFVENGMPESKLAMLPLGVDTRSFRPSQETLDNRRKRILAGEPLTVLFTGTLNYRKGLYDFEKMVNAVDPRRFRFRIVGSAPAEGTALVAKLKDRVEFIPRQPQSKLPQVYAQGDLFLFPTLEDGFAVVLAQAFAGALPILTTPNCAGPDLIKHDETGWILPIRNANAFIEQLRWCDEHRHELADMVDRIHGDFHTRDWNDVAVNFEEIARSAGIL